MQHDVSSINGRNLRALDGEVGKIADLLFDDRDWCVRWAVVLTGYDQTRRQVLVPAGALGTVGALQNDVSVRLSRSQVLDSEEVDTHRPVSRQREIELMHAYGWDPYWGDGTYLGAYRRGSMPGHDPLPTLSLDQQSVLDAQPNYNDANLRSMKRVVGSKLHATDGDIGSVVDFVIDENHWGVVSLVALTAASPPKQRVRIDPRDVESIDWAGGLVNLRVDQAAVNASPLDDRFTLNGRF